MDKIKPGDGTKPGGGPFIAKCVTFRPPALLKTGEMSRCNNFRNYYPGIRKRRGTKALHTTSLNIVLAAECPAVVVADPSFWSETQMTGDATSWSAMRPIYTGLPAVIDRRLDAYQIAIYGTTSPPEFYIIRTLVPFDMRPYASGTVTSSSIKLYLKSKTSPAVLPSIPTRLCLVKSQRTPLLTTPQMYLSFPSSNFQNLPCNGAGAMALASDTIIDTDTIALDGLMEFPLNATGLSYMNTALGKVAEFIVVEYDHDFLQVNPVDVQSMVEIYGGDRFAGLTCSTYPGLISHLEATLDLGTEPLSIFQYVKARESDLVGEYERHTFMQTTDGKLLLATNEPPIVTTGSFGSTFFNSGSAPDLPASFSEMGNWMIFSDGINHHKIWTGEREKIKACVVQTTLTPTIIGDSGVDIWEDVVDSGDGQVALVPVLSPTSGGLLVCSQTKANRLIFKMGPLKQTTTRLASLEYFTGYNSLSTATITDGTILSGKSFGQDGTISWTATTSEIPVFINGIFGYWYVIRPVGGAFSGFHVDGIEYANDAMVDVTNMCDGIVQECIEASVYKSVDGSSESYSTDAIDLSLLDVSADYFMVATDLPAYAFLVDVGATPNTTGAILEKIYYWNGTALVDVYSTSKDTTSGLKNTGGIYIPNHTPQKQYLNGSPIALYWYRFNFRTTDVDLPDNVSVLFQYIPAIDSDALGQVGICSTFWKDRAVYAFDRYPSWIYVSAKDQPNVLNGNDFAVLKAGDGRRNRIVAMKKFHNELMVFQEEHGRDGGCVTLFEGYSPPTFGKLVITTKVGGFNQNAVAIVDGSAAGTTRRDDTIQTKAYWISHYGIFESDGRTVTRISGEIQNYFDNRFTECIRKGYEKLMWAYFDSTERIVRFGIVSGPSATKVNVFPCYDVVTGTWFFDTYATAGLGLRAMSEADAESGERSHIQVGATDGFFCHINYGLNDLGSVITADCIMEGNGGSALVSMDEVWVRMMAQAGGICNYRGWECGVMISEYGRDISTAAEATGEILLRERVVTSSNQKSNISLQFINSQLDMDFFLYDWMASNAIHRNR